MQWMSLTPPSDVTLQLAVQTMAERLERRFLKCFATGGVGMYRSSDVL